MEENHQFFQKNTFNSSFEAKKRTKYKIQTIMCIKFGTNEQYQQKTWFPSTRKVLAFDLNGQHMRKYEVPEGNWVLGCSPDHSTIRPKILSLKSQSERQVRKT